ncbi:unnamed protein product [Rotaria sp. Silwood1]|nr:unnamed protein product [Rotaria sp. Silwood1]
MSISMHDNAQFVLPVNCPLHLFIRQQMHDCGIITSTAHRNSTRLRLIEPVSLIDDFSTWQYDHWHGLFDLTLEPYERDHNIHFPARWHLADNVQIYCRIKNDDSSQPTSSSPTDSPRTASLDVFIHDICDRENNGRANKWLRALDEEDIFTFEHLTNLRQSEWDNIHSLPLNAKKILKEAVDREREHAAGERRQRIINDPKDENNEQTESTKPSDDFPYSCSEIIANLHLIKLLIWHTLRDDKIVRDHGALSRIDAKCLDIAFEEMRTEGFADDGLFPKMKEFFLPLTISEHEFHLKRQSSVDEHLAHLKRRDQLCADMQQRMIKRDEIIERYQKLDDEILRLTQRLKDAENVYMQSRTKLASSNDYEQQTKAEALRLYHARWERDQLHLYEQLNDVRKRKDDLEKEEKNLQKEIEEDNARLKMMEFELDAPHEHLGKQLIKPPRGLIMYGPPGTGKSDIMSKLAKKLGILTVGPPLAAGELNRPLVGESERILIALCTRCYRVPYAMCCISIDEIDSLAPKRDEDSSESKVDKISVLLSLIEGIKDVPNLMILCATNRLHIMDEAFLRRMSGKFFMGRPSSDARITILKRIPNWALEYGLIDRLSIATTNFSGAAVKALVHAITVTCMAAQRTEPNYRLDEIEALQLADRTAQQYQIFIGSETLPRLLLRNKLDSARSRTYQLSTNCKYTGRIVVDLCHHRIRIEIYGQGSNACNDKLSIVEYELDENETNVQTLLERLTAYGKNRNVQLLQLIDLNLLASQSAYDEKKVYETLKDRYDEYAAYARSMIVYDLDALVGVNKSEADSNMGRSISSSVHNQSIYTYVLARFRDRAMEEGQHKDRDNMERWSVAVIRESFLLRQFCKDVQFTLTRQEEEELELERHKAEDLLKCVKCKDFYIENENRMGSCLHHDGFLYDITAANLKIYTPSEALKLLSKIESNAIKYPDQRDKFEVQKQKFKWICCDVIFTSGCVGGCKKGKHGFVVDLSQQFLRQLSHDNTNVLNQTVIQQWDEFCRINVEYNNKWLSLFNES